ncbi:hypothetical protein J2W20_002946 [Sinomonas atrocyanea]|uniref:GmrSD restriction endonuclease domain-containing protein n=1 Tax=Sinomonas atrocyanea TaxID=37927 RepID=UPI00278206DB|nr:DUF262 domain-containing protein [Sinomonas atrocyanea]MDQ0261032.1 hypothetical protein [Sinomonas atrocyanea]
MANKRTTIDDPDLIELLDGIDQGLIGLPNFQRDFDWSDSDIRALLATVLNGWPMGSLLLIDGDSQSRDFYDPRHFEFAPKLRGTPEMIVLDGQQRLTSLYSALYGRSESVHAVRCRPGMQWGDIDSLDSAITTFKRTIWEEKYPSPREQWRSRLIPATALRSAIDFYAWRDLAVDDERERDEITEIYRSHLSGLYRYRIPALVVSKGTLPAAVARIFERVNKTGQQLGTFDLMVAKSFTSNFNLRVKWDQAKELYPAVGAFYGENGLAPLQVISMRYQEDIRASRVLGLSAVTIHDHWDSAVAALDSAIRFSMDHLGIRTGSWLPYPNMMIVLAAYAWSGESFRHALILKNWFWASSFTGRYAVGSNTVAESDYKKLSAGTWLADGIRIDWPTLRDSTKQASGAIHRAWLCAVAAGAGRQLGQTLEVPIPRSVLPRNAWAPDGPAPHLLTLGFVLETETRELLSSRMQPQEAVAATGINNSVSLLRFLRDRAEQLVSFLKEECRIPVTLIDSELYEIEGHTD